MIPLIYIPDGNYGACRKQLRLLMGGDTGNACGDLSKGSPKKGRFFGV